MLDRKLKQLRLEKNLLQKDIAKALNITTSAYGFYEQGKRTPDTSTIEKLAEFYNVSVDYLLGRTKIRNVENNTTLTPKEHENIEEVIGELRERLLNTKDLKFDGKPATNEDIKTILDSVRVGIEMAKIKKRRNE